MTTKIILAWSVRYCWLFTVLKEDYEIAKNRKNIIDQVILVYIYHALLLFFDV